jgi:hypothetical protein
MALKHIEHKEWRTYCDMLSKILAGTRAEVEVASLRLGAQVEAEWLPFLGIVYDPKDDVIEIALEGVDHIIHKPRELYVDYGIGGLAAIEVVDGDDVRHIVRLREPLALPAPLDHAAPQGV